MQAEIRTCYLPIANPALYHTATRKGIQPVKFLSILMAIFPSEPGLASFKLRMTEVVVTTGAVNHAKLQLNHHHQQTNIQLFTGRMPFLSPNQQCQSSEGKIVKNSCQQFPNVLLKWKTHGGPSLTWINLPVTQHFHVSVNWMVIYLINDVMLQFAFSDCHCWLGDSKHPSSAVLKGSFWRHLVDHAEPKVMVDVCSVKFLAEQS